MALNRPPFHFAQSIAGKETVAPSKEEGLDDLLPELV